MPTGVYNHKKGKNSSHWKGGKPNCLNCNKKLVNYDALYCKSHAAKLSVKIRPQTFKKGHIMTTGIRRRISSTLKQLMKEGRHPSWKGGVTPLNHIIRESLEYRLWRETIFKRDHFECQICGEIGGKLRANHIKKFSDYKDLRLEITNGITICERCDKLLVMWHEPEWESYFNFNLMNRGVNYGGL